MGGSAETTEDLRPPVGHLEGLIEEASAHGLRINNLFQVADGWRANLTDGNQFYEFGEGADAVQALRAALEKAGARSSSPASRAGR